MTQPQAPMLADVLGFSPDFGTLMLWVRRGVGFHVARLGVTKRRCQPRLGITEPYAKLGTKQISVEGQRKERNWTRFNKYLLSTLYA